MRIIVNHRFVSRKTNITWEKGGMSKGPYQRWLDALAEALEPFGEELKSWFEKRKKLNILVEILSNGRHIHFDLHDAVAQIVDELTDLIYPRMKGKSIPQWQDKQFWQIAGEKIDNAVESVVIRIDKLVQP